MERGQLGTARLAALCSVLMAIAPACFGAEPPSPTRFQDAVRAGNFDLVRSMLAEDSSLAKGGRGESGATPLYFAVSHGHANIVRLLLENGAEVNARDSNRGILRNPPPTCCAGMAPYERHPDEAIGAGSGRSAEPRNSVNG